MRSTKWRTLKDHSDWAGLTRPVFHWGGSCTYLVLLLVCLFVSSPGDLLLLKTYFWLASDFEAESPSEDSLCLAVSAICSLCFPLASFILLVESFACPAASCLFFSAHCFFGAWCWCFSSRTRGVTRHWTLDDLVLFKDSLAIYCQTSPSLEREWSEPTMHPECTLTHASSL